ncbi:MFS transporter [Mangrovactinospora gilvigrisea]|uniref:MFS transporter n=1 Tax=Mangrovactinospora gilvigrisea TaxID=1428644 RepID=A0A1J7BIA8_9ACTN|nr:MFS transporter [Mangrovactinospora gilvigrisea]OIV38407.1 MFS transporter [Mangrovactinospora gilvigrisea]
MRGVLGARHAVRLLGGTLIGRLPVGMASLAVLLFTREHGGSYALAGLLTASYALGQAVGQPLLGRLVDLRGQPRVIGGAALLATAAFAALAAAGPHRGAGSFALAAAAGLFTPPLEAGLRALWPAVLPDAAHVRAAYALDAATQELLFVAGPLLVTLFADGLSTAWGLVLTGLLGLAGALVVITAPPSRSWRPGPREAHWLGPLRSPGLLALFGAFLFVGVALGAMNVGALGYAARIGDRNASGVLLAAFSFGALLGGVGYGSRTWTGRPERRLRLLTAALAVCFLPPALGPGLLPAMAALTALAGLFLAPSLACAFLVVDGHAPAGTVTEAFSWLVTAFGVGAAAGSAVAGPATGRLGDGAGFLVAAAGALAALAVQLGSAPLLARSDRSGSANPVN